MYSLIVSPIAQKGLKHIQKLYEQEIQDAIAEIKEDPLIGKPLSRELTNRFSYRIGVYRIIYTVNKQDKVVEILSAGHRSSVYQ